VLADTKADATKIIDWLTTGAGVGLTYDRLSVLVDKIGNRQCGSPNYDNAVAYMKQQLEADGLLNVHGENATVDRWVRGQESATLLSPRQVNLSILGLGYSIGTQTYGPNGLTADVVVVETFNELDALGKNVSGKIVVFNEQCDWENQPVNCYSLTIDYRESAASAASKYGAVAALVRSLTGFSIYSPHTGMQEYDKTVKPIPVASLTVEDASMLERMYKRGEPITINLKMEAQYIGTVQNENVVAEIKGSLYPEETVIVSGHLDSWDVGGGAMDDGGGAFISWTVLTALKQLNIQPLRTIRLVLWACEELGGLGSKSYFNNHQNEIPTMSLVMESDMGTFQPTGIGFSGTATARQIIIEQVAPLAAPLNTTLVTDDGSEEDNGPWIDAGVPGANLGNENQKYFWFHHSQGDRMEVLNSTILDLCSATWAVYALGVANLDSLLPR